MTVTADIHTVALGHHRDWLGIVGAWRWQEWAVNDPSRPLAAWIAELAATSHVDRIPTTLVATLDDTPVGAVSLLSGESFDDPELDRLTPWLSGLVVTPQQRGRGVGTALVRACEAWAGLAGADRLYLHTSTASAFYAGLGWSPLRQVPEADRMVTVMWRILADGVHKGHESGGDGQ